MYILLLSGIITFIPEHVHAQEEESAEISLEENIDEFQEHFFEALKQRGIENFDRAVDELLKCQKIDNSATISFELGKNYFSLKEYEKAKEAFQTAVNKKPQNQWYLTGLFNVKVKMGEREEALDIGKKVVRLNPQFGEEIAKVYVGMGEYKKALKELEKLQKTGGLSFTAANMKAMLDQNFSKKKKQNGKVAKGINQTPKPRVRGDGKILDQVKDALKTESYEAANRLAKIGLNDFPSQPKLYLYNAKALNALKQYKKAIEMLEIGLDYIIDDAPLEKEFYQTFVAAYKKMGNSKKEKFYQKKIQ